MILPSHRRKRGGRSKRGWRPINAGGFVRFNLCFASLLRFAFSLLLFLFSFFVSVFFFFLLRFFFFSFFLFTTDSVMQRRYFRRKNVAALCFCIFLNIANLLARKTTIAADISYFSFQLQSMRIPGICATSQR